MYNATVLQISEDIERIPPPLPSYSEQEVDLPPEYTLTDPSFPSTLDVDNIFHSIESYFGQDSDISEEEDNFEDSDVGYDRMNTYHAPDDDHQIHHVLSLFANRRQSPGEIPQLVPKRESTSLSSRSISIRTRARNAKLSRRKALPRDSTTDPNSVTWESAKDPAKPHNWPRHRRWTSTVLIAAFAFIAPMASTIVAPALGDTADEFRIEEGSAESFLIMPISLLAFAVGPFL